MVRGTNSYLLIFTVNYSIRMQINWHVSPNNYSSMLSIYVLSYLLLYALITANIAFFAFTNQSGRQAQASRGQVCFSYLLRNWKRCRNSETLRNIMSHDKRLL